MTAKITSTAPIESVDQAITQDRQPGDCHGRKERDEISQDPDQKADHDDGIQRSFQKWVHCSLLITIDTAHPGLEYLRHFDTAISLAGNFPGWRS